MPTKFIPMKKMACAVAVALPSIAFAAPASTSAYNTDPQNSYVEDATSKGIGQVNMITCFIGAMAPDKLVNQGNYIALVDQAKCDPNSRSSASNSSGSGTQAADYMTAIVNSSRASNSDPMIAKVWVNDVNDGHQSTIYIHTSAQQAPSATLPYGIFRLDFCGRADGMNLPACMMNGLLKADSTGLSYFQTENRDQGGVNTTALRLSASTTDSGSGRLDILEAQNNQSAHSVFNFSYNHDYFLRGDQCFGRDANDADFSVWRYGLYDAVTGDRVTVNSGFPIEYKPNASTQTYHGYLGYSGLSLPPDAMTALASEANPVVQKVDYGNNGQTPSRTNYSVVMAAGKLTKYTKNTRHLNEIDQIKMTIFVGNATGFFSGAMANAQYEVYWDNNANSFMADGIVDCGGNGCSTNALDAPQAIPLSFWSNMGGVQGWSQSLGGEVFIDLHGQSTISDSTAITVVYRTQDLVYPSDMPAQLFCLRDCPTAASMSSYFAPNSSDMSPLTLSNNWNPVTSGQQVAYTTSTTTALLMDAQSQPVVFTDANALQQHPQYQSGVRSGRLFTSADLTAVACDDQSGNLCDYKVNSLDVYYVWETGASSWNQLATVKDTNGNYLHFDAPLQLNYTVPATGAQYGEYAGKSMVLQYGGFGDLWGLPGHCVSHLTNQTVNCGMQNEDVRYVPAFAIKKGELVTSGQHTYLVKWLEREIRFARKDMSDGVSCAGLSTATINVTLPTAADLKDPSSPAQIDVYIGEKPTLTDSPRVIQGDVKY